MNELLSKRQCGVLFVIDVDHFKAINDRYGHLAGDGVLQEIAHALTDMTLCNDVIGRIGGDEFVILCRSGKGPILWNPAAVRSNSISGICRVPSLWKTACPSRFAEAVIKRGTITAACLTVRTSAC